MYDALVSSVADVENSKILPLIKDKRDAAWNALLTNYPDMEPVIITHTWRFGSQMGDVIKHYE